jgi:hypothetical protein
MSNLLAQQANTVAPAKAGAQRHRLDSGLRRNDEQSVSLPGYQGRAYCHQPPW